MLHEEVLKLVLADRLRESLDRAWAASVPYFKKASAARAAMRKKERMLKDLEEGRDFGV